MLKKTLLILLMVVLSITAMAVIAVKYQRAPQVLTVHDDLEQELEFFDLPQRLVVLEPGAACRLQAWRREQLVVGVSSEGAHLFPRAENLGPRQAITPLQIAAIRADLIIVGAESSTLAQRLREAGFPVLTFAPSRLAQLLAGPELLGLLVEAEAEANEFRLELVEQLASFRQEAKEQVGPEARVLWISDPQLTVAGLNSLEDDLIQLAGGSNAAEHVDGKVPLMLEDIAQLKPTLILAPPESVPLLEEIFLQATAAEEEMQLPRIISPPADLLAVNWDNVLEKANWLKQELLLPEENIGE
ncbi:MAG: ABC transporter substrate-binding protein [Firmicutes bacterium]|nr:ABC transporter substrate-binding protein [Bacillota bacterium]